MAGTKSARRATKAPTRRKKTGGNLPPVNGKADGFHVPFRVMPVAVYGAWKLGDWTTVKEADGHFCVDHGTKHLLYLCTAGMNGSSW
jgi:hypothetical protein